VDGDTILDEVLVSVFRAPSSYTKENSAEISCHGSPYIQQKIIELLVRNGARIAQGGEFTMRAFLNGQMDLAQAEAVADLISSSSGQSHQLAMKQLKGHVSGEINQLREHSSSLQAC
jgi:tRNA modification GTPase trmE